MMEPEHFEKKNIIKFKSRQLREKYFDGDMRIIEEPDHAAQAGGSRFRVVEIDTGEEHEFFADTKDFALVEEYDEDPLKDELKS